MAAPTATARQSPDGIHLFDGYQTLIAFASDPDVELWEKSTTPPGYDNDEKINITTFHNTALRTFAPRSLSTVTDCTFVAAYDPIVYDSVYTLMGVNQAITVTHSDGSTFSFWGYLQKFIPSENTEGSQPEATVTIVATNYDPTNNVEGLYALTSVGTY